MWRADIMFLGAALYLTSRFHRKVEVGLLKDLFWSVMSLNLFSS